MQYQTIVVIILTKCILSVVIAMKTSIWIKYTLSAVSCVYSGRTIQAAFIQIQWKVGVERKPLHPASLWNDKEETNILNKRSELSSLIPFEAISFGLQIRSRIKTNCLSSRNFFHIKNKNKWVSNRKKSTNKRINHSIAWLSNANMTQTNTVCSFSRLNWITFGTPACTNVTEIG